MSAHADKVVVSDVNTSVGRRRAIKKVLLVGLVGLVIVGTGVIIYAYSKVTKQDDTPKGGASGQNYTPDPATIAQEEALLGNYDVAQQTLDDELKKSDTDAAKAEVYNEKSVTAYNENKFKEALGFAQQSEELNATQSSAYLIAIAAEGLGDKKLALEYYKKALERVRPADRSRSPDIAEGYEAKIKELSQ